ncbi:MAG: DUF3108 domain-containing protein [Bacteroidia bacterium]|nr:DUF3108 domain-containing protein [Bacteroidia bacterium]
MSIPILKKGMKTRIMNEKNAVIILIIIVLSMYLNGTIPFQTYSNAYQAGENLKYKLHYGWINGGYASLKVENSKVNDTDVLRIVLNGKTTGLTDKLYRVNDTYESYVLPKNGLPLKAIRNIHEQNYRDYNEVIYNQENDFVISQKTGKHFVPDNTLDILSAFYYLRNLLMDKGSSGLTINDIITLTTFFGDEIYPLIIKYKGTEKINTDLGTIRCLRFQPVTEVGRVFKDNDDMTIWISDDLNYVPIRVQFELFIGSVKCDLIEYSGLKSNLIIY